MIDVTHLLGQDQLKTSERQITQSPAYLICNGQHGVQESLSFLKQFKIPKPKTLMVLQLPAMHQCEKNRLYSTQCPQAS